jgi:hypothetical protein
MINTPVLFLIFNRSDTTRQVFESIRQAKPAKLYVAADGARPDTAGEEVKIKEVRSIATSVDWECEVKTLFREHNLGCKMAVSSAITWFFEHEQEGIILEDDCLPEQTFFPYCQELLEIYRHDTRVMAISGDNFQQGKKRTEYSYYFSRYPHCWGWATWKRAWQHWDGDFTSWPEIKEKFFLNDLAMGDETLVTYWAKIYDQCHAGKIDSWAYPWNYSCWVQSGLAALPNVNLVSNIGVGAGATHTTKADDKYLQLPVEQLVFPLQHPHCVFRNVQADRFFDYVILRISENQGKKSQMNRLLSRVKKLYFR